ESGRLHVPAAMVEPDIASNAARRRIGVEIVSQGKPEPELLNQPLGVLPRAGSDRQDPGVQCLDLGTVLLEVSQLLTALFAPLPPIKETHRMVPSQVFGEADLAT